MGTRFCQVHYFPFSISEQILGTPECQNLSSLYLNIFWPFKYLHQTKYIINTLEFMIFFIVLQLNPSGMLTQATFSNMTGLNTSLVPMYISEIAPLNLRGGLGTVNQLAVTVGLLLSQVLGIEQILGTDEGWPILLGESGLVLLILGTSLR
jgi:hypothetical protein